MGLWAAGLVGILVVLDQLTKVLALQYLKPVGSITVFPHVLDLTFVENRGVAFGLFSGQRWFILLVTAVICVGLIWYWKSLPQKKEYKPLRISLLLILGGAISNILDRLFRGYVVDFFDAAFIDFPVFNVADICVVGGVLLLMVLILFFIKEEKQP